VEKLNGVVELKETFDKMPTNTTCSFIVNERFTLINIPWIETGRGFGEYSFIVEDNKLILDNESDGRDAIKKVLDYLIDNNPEAVKKMFHQMVDLCELRDKV